MHLKEANDAGPDTEQTDKDLHCLLSPFCPRGGSVVLGKLPMPGLPTNLVNSRARAHCTCSRCSGEVVWMFFFLLFVIFLLFLPLSRRWPNID